MISRRTLLAGLGVGGMAALLNPWLRRALAAGSTPCRFVFIVEGNALEPVAMMSPTTRAAIDADSTGNTAGQRWFTRHYGHSAPLEIPAGDLAAAPALGALSGGAGQLDLTDQALAVLGLSNPAAGGGHSTGFGALSCSRSSSSRPSGQSIDALLGSVPGIRGTTPFDVLRCGVDDSTDRLTSNSCAFAAARPAPVILDPGLTHQTLFGFMPSSDGHASFNRRSDLIDFGLDDVSATLSQFDGTSSERAKLEEYLSSLNELRDRQNSLLGLSAGGFVAPPNPSTNPLYVSGHTFDKLAAQVENVGAALIGGLTNVAVITSGTASGFSYMTYPSVLSNQPGVSTNLTRHDLHHGSSGNANYIQAIHAVSAAHVGLAAQLARTLAAQPEGNGTMLDNTIIVYLSDNGEQHHSTGVEWPALILGGQNLGMRTDGRTLVYPGDGHANNRHISNLFNTLGYAGGTVLDAFGHEGQNRLAEGPLLELWA